MQALVSNLSTITIPTNVEAAVQNIEWKKAVLVEMGALGKNGTWEVVE